MWIQKLRGYEQTKPGSEKKMKREIKVSQN